MHQMKVKTKMLNDVHEDRKIDIGHSKFQSESECVCVYRKPKGNVDNQQTNQIVLQIIRIETVY